MNLHHRDDAAPASPSDDPRFAELYRRWRRPVVNLCRRSLGPGHDAEAIAQEAFIRAWLSWNQFAEERPFGPWVATIARRLCMNEARARSRRDRLTAKVASWEVPAGRDDDVDVLLRAEAVRAAMGTLSTRHRHLLELFHLRGWSYDEIARFDGTTVESVRGVLKRARVALRSALRQSEGPLWGGVLLRVEGWARRLAGTVVGRVTGIEPVAALVALGLLGPFVGAPPSAPPVGSDVAAPAVVATDVKATLGTTAEGAGRARSARPENGASRSPAASPVDDTVDDEGSRGWGYQFTASPSYDKDTTVFAAGTTDHCEQGLPVCPVLLRSTDAGTTWRRLPALGWPFGEIVLPPAYPADPRIFSVAPSGLLVSDDGGATFRVLAPLGGFPAISPLFGAGDARILLGDNTLAGTAREYDADAGLVRPLQLPLPAGVTATRFAFSPTYASDRRVLVSGYSPTARFSLGGVPTLFSCDADGCVATIEGAPGMLPTAIWRPGPAPVAFAWTPNAVFRSTGGTAHFERLSLPPMTPESSVGWMASSADGRLTLAIVERGVSPALATRLYSSVDDGATWTATGTDDGLLGSITVLPDGRLLGAATAQAGGGIRWSSDAGRTWRSRSA